MVLPNEVWAMLTAMASHVFGSTCLDVANRPMLSYTFPMPGGAGVVPARANGALMRPFSFGDSFGMIEDQRRRLGDRFRSRLDLGRAGRRCGRY